MRWLDLLARRRPRLAAVVLPAVLVLGVFDQASTWAVPRHGEFQAAFRRDADLVRQIEADLPPGSMVFQLPINVFPEGLPVEKMQAYDPLRPYLHSRTLLWSAPAVHGGPVERWQLQIAALPPAQLVSALVEAHSAGLLVDRHGYPDQAAVLEHELGPPRRISADGRFAFYALSPRAAAGSRPRSPDRPRRRTARRGGARPRRTR